MNPDQLWPADGNELVLRLKYWWSSNAWLVSKRPPVPMKDRES